MKWRRYVELKIILKWKYENCKNIKWTLQEFETQNPELIWKFWYNTKKVRLLLAFQCFSINIYSPFFQTHVKEIEVMNKAHKCVMSVLWKKDNSFKKDLLIQADIIFNILCLLYTFLSFVFVYFPFYSISVLYPLKIVIIKFDSIRSYSHVQKTNIFQNR